MSEGRVALSTGDGTQFLDWKGPGVYNFMVDEDNHIAVSICLPSRKRDNNMLKLAMSYAEDVTKSFSFDTPEERANKTLEIAEQFYRFLVAAS